MPRNGPRYTEQEARVAVAASRSYTEALRALGMRPAGGNHATLRRYVEEVWRIPHDHFDPHAATREMLARRNAARPLSDVLVEHSTYSRSSLKRRLLGEGLKQPICELCGQGELWRGRRMSLILDHINGVADDHRLENLQIVCPNCAATLDTHCGKQNRRLLACEGCGEEFAARHGGQRFCSQACAYRRDVGVAKPEQRRVARPPYNHLVREIHAMGWSAVGRRYGVSDNAVRKWVRQYERERERALERGGARPEERGEEAA
jgi:HNH endonuclease